MFAAMLMPEVPIYENNSFVFRQYYIRTSRQFAHIFSVSKSLSKPDCSVGGATLFLAGADHGRYEKEK